MKELITVTTQADNLVVFAIDKSEKKSKSFLAELPALTEKLQKQFPSLKFVIVDKDTEESTDDILFEKFDILSFPACMLFKNGVIIHFRGKLKDDQIAPFLKKRLDAKIIEAKTLKDLESFDNDLYTVFYYTKKLDHAAYFQGAASKYHQFRFVKASNAKILVDFLQKYKVSASDVSDTILGARRHHDNTMLVLNDAEKATDKVLSKFIRSSEKPFWTYFNTRSVELIESAEKDVLLYLYEEGKEDKMMETIKNISRLYYDDMIAILMPKDNKKVNDLLSALGLPLTSNLYMVRKEFGSSYAKYVGGEKYLVNQAALEGFIQSCLDNTQKRFYKSEAVPTKSLFEGVETLVGLNIDEKVFKEKSKYHVVFFYDSETSSQIPAFQRLGQLLKNEKIKLYVYNTDHNEHKYVESAHHGTINIYSNRKKLLLDKAFFFDSHLKAKTLLNFLRAHLKRDAEVSAYLKTLELNDDL